MGLGRERAQEGDGMKCEMKISPGEVAEIGR